MTSSDDPRRLHAGWLRDHAQILDDLGVLDDGGPGDGAMAVQMRMAADELDEAADRIDELAARREAENKRFFASMARWSGERADMRAHMADQYMLGYKAGLDDGFNQEQNEEPF